MILSPVAVADIPGNDRDALGNIGIAECRDAYSHIDALAGFSDLHSFLLGLGEAFRTDVRTQTLSGKQHVHLPADDFIRRVTVQALGRLVPSGDGSGMQWIAIMPLGLVFLVLTLPALIFALSGFLLRFAIGLGIAGLVAFALLWNELLKEFYH